METGKPGSFSPSSEPQARVARCCSAGVLTREGRSPISVNLAIVARCCSAGVLTRERRSRISVNLAIVARCCSAGVLTRERRSSITVNLAIVARCCSAGVLTRERRSPINVKLAIVAGQNETMETNETDETLFFRPLESTGYPAKKSHRLWKRPKSVPFWDIFPFWNSGPSR